MFPHTQHIILPDGRRLCFDEYGSPTGTPLFYFHGSPSSRKEFGQFVGIDVIETFHLRVIVPDRPGSGLSTFQPHRQFLDWPKDVATLADHLGLAQFAILGYSGGGPYAVACAHKTPERLTQVGVVSGAAPFDMPGLTESIPQENLRFFDLARYRPQLSRLTLRLMGAMTHLVPQKVIANAFATLPEPDQKVLSDPPFQKGFLAMIQEALRHGPRGAQHETRLMVSAWDFRPQEVQFPIRLWHGEADRNAPVAMGRYMAANLPHCQAQFYPLEGHLSLFKKYAKEILRALVAESTVKNPLKKGDPK